MSLQSNTKYPNLSFWESSSFLHKVDLLIVGGGIVGLNAAITYQTRYPQAKVRVIDRGVFPLGASTRNAGFACFGSMTELLDDLEHTDEATVFGLVEKRWRGLHNLRQRIGDRAMEYEELGGYELFREEENTVFEKCQARMGDFNRILEGITGKENIYQLQGVRWAGFGFAGVQKMIWNRVEGQINTGKMMYRLLELTRSLGVEIITGVSVKDLESKTTGVKVNCDNGWTVEAEKVLVTTNGFAKQLLPDLEVEAVRNQVLITEPLSNLPFRGCFHYDKGYYYFRNVDNRILLGGGRNLAFAEETTDEFGHSPRIQSALQTLLKEVIYPHGDAPITQWWSGILGVGKQKKSIVEDLGQGIFAAVRMGGMGVAIGTLIGEEAAKMVADS